MFINKNGALNPTVFECLGPILSSFLLFLSLSFRILSPLLSSVSVAYQCKLRVRSESLEVI